MAKFEGRGKCDRACCGAAVDVYSDKNGMAYYNCGPCGVRMLHKKRTASERFLSEIDRHAEADDGAPPPAPPAAAAPAPARTKASEQAPRQQPAPSPRKGGFLSNFTL